MKYNIPIVTCTALLALGVNLSSAQPKRVEARTLADPALAPEPPEVPIVAVANFDEAVNAYQWATGTSGQSGSSRALVIPKEAGDAKEFADLEEDMNVMARILEKAASGRDDKHPHAMGIAIQNGFGSASVPKNLYIEGHGALFFLNVNYPLLAPATKSSDAEPKEKTSTEWEEARRELYQPRGSGFFEFKTANFGGPAEEYDADKVEDLKRDVTDALKNAAHIRNLKSDEMITVVVSGRGSGAQAKAMRRTGGGAGSGSNGRTVYAVGKSSGGDGRGTKLIIRARKSDIDAFQKDKLNAEDFRKKVTLITY